MTEETKMVTIEEIKNSEMPKEFIQGVLMAMQAEGQTELSLEDYEGCKTDWEEHLAEKEKDDMLIADEKAFTHDWDELFTKHPTIKAMVVYTQDGRKGFGSHVSPSIPEESRFIYRLAFTASLKNKN